ncbi:MAG TPA: hypothetical protein VMW41_06410 [Candidatus Bathyarchaeia archaeon]|nr:hypothetical protein [Candidatus Bathyarchaeia archaeon]
MTTQHEENRAERPLLQTVTLYTEVSSRRAKELVGGTMESSSEAISNLTRWISEIVLQDTQPEELKALGISRSQPIFATPVPFQGATPMKGKVLLTFETNPSHVYVAEGDHLTAMRQVGIIDMGLYSKLRQAIGKSTEVTFNEFLPHYQSLPRQDKDNIVAGIAPLAHNYWTSVVPYSEYIKFPQPYTEPETLLLPQAPIVSLRKI